jgi:thiamine-phosphate pyrophosphorylase
VSTDLSGAKLYLVAPGKIRAGRLANLIPELAAAGVDLVQLREKDMEAGDLIRVAGAILEACRRAGIPFILNDRPDVALVLGADGVHVGQNDLPPSAARRFFPDGVVGWSTHRPEEVDSAMGAEIDYFAVGPVYETPTKPGRPAAGLELIRYAASKSTKVPWFGIGGIHESNLESVLEAGARRIVVVRAITGSDDPPAAAARLKSQLLAAI